VAPSEPGDDDTLIDLNREQDTTEI